MLPATTLAEIEALIAQARSGDTQAIPALIAKSLPFMKKYLAPSWGNQKRAGTAAMDTDIVMDAAERAARKFSSFKGTTAPSFLSWLKRIVVRRGIDAIRSANRKKRKTVLATEPLPVGLGSGTESGAEPEKPSERLEAIETWLTVLNALLALPAKQREAFWLCSICERSQEEVAAKLGRTRAMIAGDLSRARAALQSLFRSIARVENLAMGTGAVPGRANVLPVESVLISGRFEMGPLSASGTVCRVHRGVDRQTGNEVAICILHYEHCSSPESVARFLNESFWLRSLSSTNVATVLSGGMLPGGQPFLVQEWLPISLADVLLQGPLSPDVASAVILQVVCGVMALHSINLIHRDLSPARFRISQWKPAFDVVGVPSIKVSSLRLAKSLAFGKTQPALPISTVGDVLPGAVEYRAPEVLLDVKRAGEASDVYSIGALWYALLTGSPPFAVASQESVQLFMQRCLHSEPPLERLPEPNALLASMLAKVPSSRPSLTNVRNCLHRA